MRRFMLAASAAAIALLGVAAPASAADPVLLAGRPWTVEAAPGSAFTAEVTVRNNGTEVVHGAALSLHTGHPIEPATSAENCRYHVGELGTAVAGACLFVQDLLPGESYQVSIPYTLRADTYAPSRYVGQFSWSPLDGFDADEHGTPGTGAPLTLDAVPSGDVTTSAFSDFDVAVTGKQGADITAIGTRVSGAAGTTVDATVSLRNNGPAVLGGSRDGDSASVAVITLPAGATVVTVPDDCGKDDDNNSDYLCDTGSLLAVGQTVSWTFGLRIDKFTPNATGSVETDPACSCQRFADDLDTSNNEASIVLNPATAPSPSPSATTSPTPSPSPTTPPSPATSPTPIATETSSAPAVVVAGDPAGAGGTGGGLPLTGPVAALIGGGGTLLVVVGILAFMVARRRRPTFQA